MKLSEDYSDFKRKLEQTHPPQRFLEIAKKLEADESGAAFERAAGFCVAQDQGAKGLVNP